MNVLAVWSRNWVRILIRKYESGPKQLHRLIGGEIALLTRCLNNTTTGLMTFIPPNTNKLQLGNATSRTHQHWHHTTTGTAKKSTDHCHHYHQCLHHNIITKTLLSPPLHCQTTYICHFHGTQYHLKRRKSLPPLKFNSFELLFLIPISVQAHPKWYNIQHTVSGESEKKTLPPPMTTSFINPP